MCIFRSIIYCSHYFMCHCSQLVDTIAICLIRYSSLLFGRSLQRRSLNHDYFPHTQCGFTLVWLNSYYSLPVLSCLFICPRKQFEEHSWSGMFVVSISWKLYVYFVHIACCCVRLLVYPLFSHTDVVGLVVTSSFYLLVLLLFTF